MTCLSTQLNKWKTFEYIIDTLFRADLSP